jgi:hypothetical protein
MVTFNDESKLIRKYENELFWCEEKNDQKLKIENKKDDFELIFEFTVKSFLTYTLDSNFDLIQDNCEKKIKPDYQNLPYESYKKIIEEGNIGTNL